MSEEKTYVVPGVSDASGAAISRDPSIGAERGSADCLATLNITDVLFVDDDAWWKGILLRGNVSSIRSLNGESFPYGVTGVEYASGDTVTEGSGGMDRAMAGVGVQGVPFEIEVEFTGMEKLSMFVHQEIGTPVPDILCNTYEGIPARCSYAAVPPETEGEIPIVVLSLFETRLEATQQEIGYNLVGEFDRESAIPDLSESLREMVESKNLPENVRARLLAVAPTVVQREAAVQGDSETVNEDVLAMFQTEDEADVAVDGSQEPVLEETIADVQQQIASEDLPEIGLAAKFDKAADENALDELKDAMFGERAEQEREMVVDEEEDDADRRERERKESTMEEVLRQSADKAKEQAEMEDDVLALLD